MHIVLLQVVLLHTALLRNRGIVILASDLFAATFARDPIRSVSVQTLPVDRVSRATRVLVLLSLSVLMHNYSFVSRDRGLAWRDTAVCCVVGPTTVLCFTGFMWKPGICQVHSLHAQKLHS